MLQGVTRRNLAFVLVGLPTWALVDVTWAMLSQLADRVPEGYNISAYLILSLTLGNLIPLLSNSRLKTSSISSIRKTIGCILVVGISCGVAMSLLWGTTVPAGGHRYSFVFCFLFFIVGACSSTSNVTHFTYVSVFRSNETTALSTGMALGSMLAGILGILQGTVLGDAGMHIAANYLAIASLYVPALWLVWSEASIIMPTTDGDGDDINDGVNTQQALLGGSALDDFQEQGGISDDFLDKVGREMKENFEDQIEQKDFVYHQYNPLLILQLVNCALGYGVVPSLVSPVCSRFASSSTVLLLATGLYCIIDPICRAATAVRPLHTLRGIQASSSLLYILAVLLLVTLLLPENSGLLTSSGGGAYAIILYVGFGVTFGFTNLSVYLFIKVHTPPRLVQDAYRWTGIVSQTGALCGSIVSFLLVVSGALY